MEQPAEVFAERRNPSLSGELRIAAGESIILYILPDLLKTYTERRPALRLTLNNVTGRDGLGLLRANELDLAVGSMHDTPNDISRAAGEHAA